MIKVVIFHRRNVGFAHPAEMLVAVATLHMIAAFSFFDWRHASRTTVEIFPPTLRPLFEGKVILSAFSFGMPLLIATKTHFIGAAGAHGSVFAAARFFYLCIAIWSRTPL